MLDTLLGDRDVGGAAQGALVTQSQDPGREHTLLEAVALAAERLLGDADPPPVPEVLAALGLAADVSRIALVAARPGGGTSSPRMESRQQWAAPGIARLGPGPDGWPRYPARWRDELGQGTTIAGPTRAFPQEERAVLDAVGVRSALLIPVAAGGEWYGHLGCHDTRAERLWAAGEIEAMRAAATILGSAIHQRRVLAEVDRRAALLHAVGAATTLLAEVSNWRQALPRVLDGLRTATRARGAWAYGPDPDSAGRRAVLLYEVLAPGARPAGGRPRSLELLPDVIERFRTAGPIHDGQEVDGIGPLREAISTRGGASWAIAPMVLEPGSVGVVGLDADGPRAWREGEVDALEIVADALTGAIRRGSTLVSVPIVSNPWGQPPAAAIGFIGEPVEAPRVAEVRIPADESRNPG